MRSSSLLAVLLTAAGVAPAQIWEVGGAGGAGFSTHSTVSNAGGKASAGLTNTPAAGVLVGQELNSRISGEIRYTFRPGGLKLSAGGDKATFNAQSHAFHYDVLYYTRPATAPVRPFLTAGAGARVFRGTGREHAYQPLQEFALLTKTREWTPLISLGAGVKKRIAPRVFLRVELRDYLTPFPKDVIAPAAGGKQSGWLHDFVPLVGISFLLDAGR